MTFYLIIIYVSNYVNILYLNNLILTIMNIVKNSEIKTLTNKSINSKETENLDKSQYQYDLLIKEINIEYSLLDEFYLELKEKLIDIVKNCNLEESTKVFIIKMFRLIEDNNNESKHFDLITFVEKLKNSCEVRLCKL